MNIKELKELLNNFKDTDTLVNFDKSTARVIVLANNNGTVWIETVDPLCDLDISKDLHELSNLDFETDNSFSRY